MSDQGGVTMGSEKIVGVDMTSAMVKNKAGESLFVKLGHYKMYLFGLVFLSIIFLFFIVKPKLSNSSKKDIPKINTSISAQKPAYEPPIEVEKDKYFKEIKK